MKEQELKIQKILDEAMTIEKDDKHIINYLMDFGNVQISVKTSTN